MPKHANIFCDAPGGCTSILMKEKQEKNLDKWILNENPFDLFFNYFPLGLEKKIKTWNNLYRSKEGYMEE